MNSYGYKKKLAIGYRSAKLSCTKIYPYLLSNYHYHHITDIASNDVVMAGYPKSGNTWLQNLVAGVLFGINSEYLADKLTQDLVPDLDYKVIYKRYLDSMCFKTHELPKSKFRKVIHLVRDPRDAMCSYWRMVQGRKGSIDIEDIVVRGDYLYFGKWKDHTRSWIENRYGAEIKIVKYEDLLTGPELELEKIFGMLGVDRTANDFLVSISGNSMANMKTKEKKYGFDKKFIASDQWVDGAKFFRKGISGGYKEELSPRIIEYIENECGGLMLELGYEV